MAKLGGIFDSSEEHPEHPVLKHLDAVKPEKTEVEVTRPQDVLGYKPARIYVRTTVTGMRQPPAEYAWDDDLNDGLIRRGFRAVSAENEKLRFALALRGGLRKAESRAGDGYFNCVLVKMVKETPLNEFAEVADVMRDVTANEPSKSSRSYNDCLEMIQNELVRRANELTEALQYERDAAEDILAGAVARFLDERFTVSDRRKLGWTGRGEEGRSL